MDLHLLESFLAVYECGSMAKAAKRLYISPQGLSKATARFESELGFSLFVRSHQGVTPTQHARSLYPKARDFMTALESIRADAQAASRSMILRVAMVSGQLGHLGIGFIDEFEQRHPNVELQLEDCTNRRVEERVLAGDVPMGLAAGPLDARRFDATLFSSCPHVLVVGYNDPLAQRSTVTYRDLADRTLVMLGDDYPVRDDLVARLAAAGAQPRRIIETAMPETVVSLAARERAVIVGTADATYGDPQADGIKVLPFEDASFSWDVYIITRVGAAPDVAVTLFRDFALSWAAREDGVETTRLMPVETTG